VERKWWRGCCHPIGLMAVSFGGLARPTLKVSRRASNVDSSQVMCSYENDSSSKCFGLILSIVSGFNRTQVVK